MSAKLFDADFARVAPDLSCEVGLVVTEAKNVAEMHDTFESDGATAKAF